MQQLTQTIIALLGATLGLGPERTATLRPDTPLWGSLPELDSMSIIAVLEALEEQLGIVIEEDALEPQAFASVESLARFVEARLKATQHESSSPPHDR